MQQTISLVNTASHADMGLSATQFTHPKIIIPSHNTLSTSSVTAYKRKLSVTNICTYSYCPRKLFLQLVLGEQEPIKDALVYGSVRHEAYDLINKKDEEIVVGVNKIMTFEELTRLYKEHHLELLKQAVLKNLERIKQLNLNPAEVFRKSWAQIASETTRRAITVHKLMDEDMLFGQELWNKLDPKIQSEISVESDDLQLRGIVDRLEVYSDGLAIPYELKTGRSPREGVWPSHRLQIGAYCLMLESKLGKRIHKGYIQYLDSEQIRPVVMNPFLESEIKEITDNTRAMIEERTLPKICLHRNKCRNCGLQKQCYDTDRIKQKLAGVS